MPTVCQEVIYMHSSSEPLCCNASGAHIRTVLYQSSPVVKMCTHYSNFKLLTVKNEKKFTAKSDAISCQTNDV